LDKWWLKTIENLPENVKRTFPFLICPKASKSERNKGLEDIEEKDPATVTSFRPTLKTHPERWKHLNKHPALRITPKKNIHPTVKPIKLMSYLITLGSREGDVVLDPFVGSGTTCIAAKMLNRRWIGIDCYPEYCEIASARLENCEIVKHGDIKIGEPDIDKQYKHRTYGEYQGTPEHATNMTLYEKYLKDTKEKPQSLIDTKTEVIQKGICPKCGSKMYKGKHGYYCTNINCDWRKSK